ncbi:uncharacterized protein ACIBXB_003815 isoform 1-T1 [Morphnus guianensis]
MTGGKAVGRWRVGFALALAAVRPQPGSASSSIPDARNTTTASPREHRTWKAAGDPPCETSPCCCLESCNTATGVEGKWPYFGKFPHNINAFNIHYSRWTLKQ